MKISTERLTECRERLNISKQKAAKLIGVSQPTYLRYESGEREPSIHVLKEIAKVYNTSVDYLIGINDSDSPDFITIEKRENPEVFILLETLKNMSESQICRFLAYAEGIRKIDEENRNSSKRQDS